MAKTLEDIFNDDDSGLLNPKDKQSGHKSDEDRLIDSFEEINSFFDKYNREPSTNTMSEYNLHAKLKGFRNDEDKKKILKPFDRFNLLGFVAMDKKTFEEIVDDDNLGLLDSDADNSIFEFHHTPRNDKRAEADYIAQRKSISDNQFSKYEIMFHRVHQELKDGSRRLLRFENIEKNLQVGNFYLLDGVLLYLESADLKQQVRALRSGDRKRVDGRTVTIFENGTISNLLFRSLGKAIQKNGKLVTQVETPYTNFMTNPKAISDDDVPSGWIYILKSKSANESIIGISNLYKIGFSKGNVNDRIKNAINEATYLFADVEIIATYRCYNLNTQTFENLIHRFFGQCCLNIDVFDKEGSRYMPREWFVVPLNIIEQAIHLILSGDIVKYKYSKDRNEIISI